MQRYIFVVLLSLLLFSSLADAKVFAGRVPRLCTSSRS
jgi:hypothetical protein